MAKASTVDEPAGMERAEIKKHLRFAREEPVSVAFALGGDGKAILQFDRRKPGRALEKQLKDADPDSRNHRWGTATVDPDDEKTVRFTVNKAGGGLARRLTVALKGTGFSKVKICLDDGTEIESHADEEGEADEGAEPTPARAEPEPTLGAAAGAATGAAASLPDDAAAVGKEAGDALAAAQPAPALDPAALAQDLTGLVKRMLGVIAKDPTQKAALTELATDAQANLKRGDLQQASAGIDIFREALDDCEKASGVAGGGATPAASHDKAVPHGPAAPHAGAGSNGAQTDHHAADGHHQDGAAHPDDLRKEGEQILATLTHAVKQALPMLNVVPGLGDMLKTVGAAVQDAVKSGRHDEARQGVQRIMAQIQQGAAAGAAGRAAGDATPPVASDATPPVASDEDAHRAHAAKQAPAIEKASHVWGATRQKVMSEIQHLEKAFTSALDGHGMADTLVKTLRTKVEETLHHLDDRLMHVLGDVNKAPDAAERAKHVEHAHKLIKHYETHVASDQTITKLDANPFRKLAIKDTVMASLAALQRTIH